MLEITPSLKIDESEIHFEFVRASGPGGQNVNKVSTAAQLRFDVLDSPSLKPEIKARLIRLAGGQITAGGVLIIEAKRYRTQEQNRQDALRRLVGLLQQAAARPKIRRATHPTAASRAARIDAKIRRGKIKRNRQAASPDLD
ncbi:MAG: aminoacyl-tRNA hydrolase [Chloroflexi bacterium]|nr:aminoacyl-tRNA hydrolase [Chloroflexota bacterium]